jgi:hypothetical protein
VQDCTGKEEKAEKPRPDHVHGTYYFHAWRFSCRFAQKIALGVAAVLMPW